MKISSNCHALITEHYILQFRSAPSVACLRINYHFNQYRADYLELLEFLKDTPTIFPALNEFSVTIREHTFAFPWDESRDIVRLFVRARKVHRLAIPNLAQANIDELEAEFDFLTATSSVSKAFSTQNYRSPDVNKLSSFSLARRNRFGTRLTSQLIFGCGLSLIYCWQSGQC